ncbi:sarcosine oxidase subunit alpha family protein [Leisingera sp. M658]|uniref:sarcosine oxidase subunit alpha family protein n=1 Tax=Leisingera sp. M658 TaxID=2867015 RepID=UPI0021A9646F|nr:sarcosine oxidase subunit alpha family protein [Leisingera sp. M658]UWQ75817.1 sarcosine oxidase subunit alpha family protein [Leisingera sp. M658]
MSAERLPQGGRIDRTSTVTVLFDGRAIPAHTGDTLASALLAADTGIVARSFKYHRPRGIYSAGVEEPNALVQLGQGAHSEPNTRATTLEAYDGLQAAGQNAWPNVRFDAQSATRIIAPFLSAGFYYKTFIGPFNGTKFWMYCETFIRKAAGMGFGVHQNDPDTYQKTNAYCDLLVIGAGPAGLSAALAAGRKGERVILAEQDFELGGSLLSNPVGSDSDKWLEDTRNELEAMNNVRILKRTTVFGAYDSDVYGAVERVWDHVRHVPDNQNRQVYWKISAKRAVMATGAIERFLAFGGNDIPGVMLASSVRTYLNRFAVMAGKTVVVATNNDSAYGTAIDLAKAGASVTVADLRLEAPADLAQQLQSHGGKVMPTTGVIAAQGRKSVTGALLAPINAEGRATAAPHSVPCDLIAVSSGWSPVVHLWSHRQKKPVFDEAARCFLPDNDAIPTLQAAGSAIAARSLADSIAQGAAAGGDPSGGTPLAAPTGAADHWARAISPIWRLTQQNGKTAGKAFVDMQHDVGTSDIELAHREGYVSVEHLKRYTTTGMATDQGKLSNLPALSRMAELRSMTIPEVGTTTFRPPFTPTAVGALAANDALHHFSPTRLSPLHDWHVEQGAELTQAGLWLRPWFYPEAGEDVDAAYRREAEHVRSQVGMVDVSTLGKIQVQGPDAAEFLNRMYVNGWKTLQIGRIRYGAMLREDGIVLDDGATARIGEYDYFMSTTTAHAAQVLALAEQLLQTAWQDLKVHVTSVTDQWAAMAVAGPKSRDLLTEVCGMVDLSADTMPNNHFVYADIADVPCRIHRMSFSGELAYEVYVPAKFGKAVWQEIMQKGATFNICPYGTESMGTLRIEKGHVAGPELDGRTTLRDIGLDKMASRKKPFVGSVLKHRPHLLAEDRPTLVGLEIEGDAGVKSGSILYDLGGSTKNHGLGWVSSTTYSPALGKYIALGFLAKGPARHGDRIRVIDFLGDSTKTAKVTSPHFFDPEGTRQNG